MPRSYATGVPSTRRGLEARNPFGAGANIAGSEIRPANEALDLVAARPPHMAIWRFIAQIPLLSQEEQGTGALAAVGTLIAIVLFMTMVQAYELKDLASPEETGQSGSKSRLVAAMVAAKELSRCLEAIPADAPEARHPSYGITRALAHTMLDMLQDLVEEGGTPTSGPRPMAAVWPKERAR
jgi:hypothetical protein